jgi:hypothetical protein
MFKNNIQVYKGKSFVKSPNIKTTSRSSSKVIVFDLDETLGSFCDLDILWRGLLEYATTNSYFVFNNTQENFNELFDLYPEFLRYGILNVLDFLYYKKIKGECDKVCIYTNNRLQKQWTNMIIQYLENKQNVDGLFDDYICAFKINKQIIDPRRTTNNKTYNELIRCLLVPRKTEICFIDNTYYDKMKNDKVYYIQPKAYYHKMKTYEIINRFVNSNFANFCNTPTYNILKTECSDFLYEWFIKNKSLNTSVKSDNEVEIDLAVSKQMMYHVREFFYMITKKNKTVKNIHHTTKSFTRKNRP